MWLKKKVATQPTQSIPAPLSGQNAQADWRVAKMNEMMMAFGRLFMTQNEQMYREALALMERHPELSGAEISALVNQQRGNADRVNSLQIAPGVVAMNQGTASRTSPNPTDPEQISGIAVTRPRTMSGVHSTKPGTQPGSQIGDPNQYMTQSESFIGPDGQKQQVMQKYVGR